MEIVRKQRNKDSISRRGKQRLRIAEKLSLPVVLEGAGRGRRPPHGGAELLRLRAPYGTTGLGFIPFSLQLQRKNNSLAHTRALTHALATFLVQREPDEY